MNERLAELQRVVSSRVNELRCLERKIQSKGFLSAYKAASETERAKVCEYIASENDEAVEQWVAVQERNISDLEELPVRDLRRLAASLRVRDYNRLGKAVLLSEIKKAKVNYEHSPDHQPDRAALQRDARTDAAVGSPRDAVRGDPKDRTRRHHTGRDVEPPDVHAGGQGRVLSEGSGDLAAAPRRSVEQVLNDG